MLDLSGPGLSGVVKGINMVAGVVGWPELVVILAVLLVLFGAKRLPELARSLGKSVKELQRGLDDDASEDVEEAEDTPPGS
jgi:sec-independent protein translocase protein TatA